MSRIGIIFATLFGLVLVQSFPARSQGNIVTTCVPEPLAKKLDWHANDGRVAIDDTDIPVIVSAIVCIVERSELSKRDGSSFEMELQTAKHKMSGLMLFGGRAGGEYVRLEDTRLYIRGATFYTLMNYRSLQCTWRFSINVDFTDGRGTVRCLDELGRRVWRDGEVNRALVLREFRSAFWLVLQAMMEKYNPH